MKSSRVMPLWVRAVRSVEPLIMGARAASSESRCRPVRSGQCSGNHARQQPRDVERGGALLQEVAVEGVTLHPCHGWPVTRPASPWGNPACPWLFCLWASRRCAPAPVAPDSGTPPRPRSPANANAMNLHGQQFPAVVFLSRKGVEKRGQPRHEFRNRFGMVVQLNSHDTELVSRRIRHDVEKIAI